MPRDQSSQSSSRTERLLRTLEAVKETWGEGLNSFLLELFSSQDGRVRSRRSQLLKTATPAELFRLWIAHASPVGRDALLQVAVEAVTAALRRELYAAAQEKTFKVKADGLKREDLKIEGDLDAYKGVLQEHLPYLSAVVASLLTTPNKRERKGRRGNLGQYKEKRVSATSMTILSILLYHHNNSCNYYPLLVGLFLSAHRVPRPAIDLFHRLSLSVSYDSTLRSKASLAENQLDLLRAQFGPSPAGKGRPFVVAFDNVDKDLHVTNERGVHSREMLHCGIGLAICVDEDVPAAAHTPEVQREAEKRRGSGNQFRLASLVEGEEREQHEKEVELFHIRQILLSFLPLRPPPPSKTNPGSAANREDTLRSSLLTTDQELSKVFPLSRRKEHPAAKTEILSLPLINTSVGSIDGVIKFLGEVRTLIEGDHASRSTFPHVIVGDGLSDKLGESAKRLREGENRREDRMTEVYFEAAPFHVTLTYESMLCKMYGGKGPASDDAGALHHVSIFSRQAPLPTDNAHHYDVWSVIYTALCGGILACAATVLGVPGFPGLKSQGFSTLEEVDTLAKKIWAHYKGFRGAATDELERTKSDEVYANWLFFLSDGLLLLEWERAVRMMDYGAMDVVMERLVFIFKGSGNYQYANILLERAIRHRVEYPPELKALAEYSMVVNPEGKEGGGQGTDLRVEHAVFWVKDDLEQAKGSANFKLGQTAAATADLRSFLKTALPRSAGLSPYSRPHHTLPRHLDVQNTLLHLMQEKVLWRREGGRKRDRGGKEEVVDLFAKGMEEWAGKSESDFSHFMAERSNEYEITVGVNGRGAFEETRENAAREEEDASAVGLRVSFLPFVDAEEFVADSEE